MKKLFMMLVVLFALYLGIQIVFDLISGGHDNEYEIEQQGIKFYVKEISNFKDDNYYFTISSGTNTFNFQIINDFNKKKNVIEKIEYFKNEVYECILPIFKNNIILSDIMCINNDIIYYYHDIKNADKQLDEFVSKINNYDVNKYSDTSNSMTVENLEVYKENLIDNHYIGMTNYKGIYNVSKNFNSIAYNITLFDKDVYNQKMGAFVDNYYIVADYNQNFEFNEFKLVDLVSLETDKIASDTSVTFDGYIQGVVDSKVYLFDKDKQVQLEINTKNKTIVRNNKANIRYYNSGNFTSMSLKDANEELKFVYGEINYQNNEYERIDRVGSETGYYYLYRNNGNGYDAYRINIQDNSGLTYLFSINNIDNIFYVDNYVYFINNSYVQVYNDNFGVRNLIKYRELEFNKNIIFNVYSR